MKHLIYILFILIISSCKKEEIVLPQIKQTKGDSTVLIKKVEKIKIKKRNKIRK